MALTAAGKVTDKGRSRPQALKRQFISTHTARVELVPFPFVMNPSFSAGCFTRAAKCQK
jgi:hypothetical protein